MTRRTLITRIIAIAGLLAASAVLAATIWLGSDHALQWTRQQVLQAGGGAVSVEGVEGSLLGEVRIAQLVVAGSDFALDAEDVTVNWQPLALLRGEIRLGRVAATSLRYRSHSTAAAKLPDSLALPLDITIAALEIRRLEISGLPAIENLRLGYSGGHIAHDIRLLQTQAAGWSIDGELRIEAQAPFTVSGTTQARRGPSTDAMQATATVSGHIEELQLDIAGGGRGASIKAVASLRPFATQPVVKFAAQARELDLSAWHAALPRTRLTVDATAESADSALTGSLQADNAVPGTIDAGRLPLAAASARYTGSGGQWALRELELRFAGGGRASGSATLRDDQGVMDLRLRDVDPTRIDSRMRPAKISGQAGISGTRQSSSSAPGFQAQDCSCRLLRGRPTTC